MSSILNDLIKGLGERERVRFTGTAWRMHNPVWAWSPLSTEGAVRTGGRFNPKGSPALYLSLSVQGCHAEVSGGATSAVLSPQLLCGYQVDVGGLLDLRDAFTSTFEPAWRLCRLNGTEPPGWKLYRALMAQPHINGLLVPSYLAPNETNLVLMRWPNGSIRLHDPDGRLAQVYGDRFDDGQ